MVGLACLRSDTEGFNLFAKKIIHALLFARENNQL